MKKNALSKFYVSVAMSDITTSGILYFNEHAFLRVMLHLQSLSKAIFTSQLAPLPKDLEGSLYDPQMLRLRSDEEFKGIYESEFIGTVEECISALICEVLIYDMKNHEKCHVYRNCPDGPYDFSTGNVLDNMLKCSDELILKLADCNSSEEKDMLAYIYPYLMQFARKLKLDLNSFIEWYLRYSRITR